MTPQARCSLARAADKHQIRAVCTSPQRTGGRLVSEQQARRRQQLGRDAEAPLLAAGEAAQHAVPDAGVRAAQQAEVREQRLHPRLPRRRGRPRRHAQLRVEPQVLRHCARACTWFTALVDTWSVQCVRQRCALGVCPRSSCGRWHACEPTREVTHAPLSW